jgi:hypothetical protein
MWILAKDPNKVVFSIDNHIFEISLNYTFEMNPTENITYTKKITYQGKTCTNWVKNFDITQEYCEATEHDMDLLKNEYSDIQRTFVDQLRSSSDNDDEFKDCLKQFNLK